jgi:benzoylformate decarboxylase
MDDWNAEADADRSAAAIARRVVGRTAPDEAALSDLAERLAGALSPVLVAGPDIDAAGGWHAAVALAEKQRLPVWASPATGGSRLGFPERHPNFAGVLPPAIGAVSETLKAHDLVLVVGSSVFPYYPYIPGPLLGETTELVALTSDPGEAARAPMGEAIVGDVGLALERLVALVPEGTRDAPEARPEPGDPPAADPPDRLSGSEAMAALADAVSDDGIIVLESPSCTLSLRNRLRISTPGSYYFCASGGLGFGIAAAVGVQLAQPARPVVCVLGEGSAQYGITALWSALAYKAPVTFLILRNDEYMILKWFAMLEQVTGAPGLDLPGLDVAAVARGYGLPAQDVSGREELTEALRASIGAGDGPRVIQVPVASGMWLE